MRSGIINFVRTSKDDSLKEKKIVSTTIE